MATPIQTDADVATHYATIEFTIRSILNRTATAELVKVQACTNSGGLAQYGFVDVTPLVNQVHGDGSTVPRGTIYKLPYHRIQGGKNAVIADPVKGDIGLAVFAWRDMSAVKADPVKAAALATGTDGTPPGSARVYDPADGMYFGGFLNGQPVNYVRIADDEIEVHHGTKVIVTSPEIDLVSPGTITITAPTVTIMGDTEVDGDLTVTGDVEVAGSVGATGDINSGGITLQTHEHPPGTYVVGSNPVTGLSGPP